MRKIASLLALLILSAALSSPAFAAQQDQGDVLALLPVFGLGFVHKLRARWNLRGHAQFFYITADNYSGSLVDALFGAVHNTFKNVGFGFGYNFMDWMSTARIKIGPVGSTLTTRALWRLSISVYAGSSTRCTRRSAHPKERAF